MELEKQKRLLEISKEIVIVTDANGKEKLNDSVMVITGKILALDIENFRFLKTWFKEKTGYEFEIPRRAIEVRNILKDYLISKNISVPEIPKYETLQSKSRTSDDFFREWGSEDVFLSSRRR